MRPETFDTVPGDTGPSPFVSGVSVASHHDDVGHQHDSLDTHTHDGDHVHTRDRLEAVPPTQPSRAVAINVGEHTGALVLASSEARSGIEVEIHPVAEPSARTHVWVLPREGREGVIYAAIFPSLECGDYAILDVGGSIGDVVAVLPNRVTHARWS